MNTARQLLKTFVGHTGQRHLAGQNLLSLQRQTAEFNRQSRSLQGEPTSLRAQITSEKLSEETVKPFVVKAILES